jgi:hypothetical protein
MGDRQAGLRSLGKKFAASSNYDLRRNRSQPLLGGMTDREPNVSHTYRFQPYLSPSASAALAR